MTSTGWTRLVVPAGTKTGNCLARISELVQFSVLCVRQKQTSYCHSKLASTAARSRTSSQLHCTKRCLGKSHLPVIQQLKGLKNSTTLAYLFIWDVVHLYCLMFYVIDFPQGDSGHKKVVSKGTWLQ